MYFKLPYLEQLSERYIFSLVCSSKYPQKSTPFPNFAALASADNQLHRASADAGHPNVGVRHRRTGFSRPGVADLCFFLRFLNVRVSTFIYL